AARGTAPARQADPGPPAARERDGQLAAVAALERDAQRGVLDRERAALVADHDPRHRGAEVAQVLAEHDRAGRVGDRRDAQLAAVDLERYLVEAAVAKCRLGERRDRAP